MDKSPKSRWEKIILGIIGVVFVVTVIVAVSRIGDKEKQSTNSTATTQAAIEKPAQEPISLSGVGEQATKKFKLEGSSVFKVTSDNPLLQADLLDSGGKKLKFLIGEKDFWSLSNLPQEYQLNVHNIEGPWAIHIEPINLANNPEIKQFDGNGSWTTNMFDMKEGLRIIKVTHSGTKNFKVSLYDDNATSWENIPGLLGKIGSNATYEGSRAVQFLRDTRYFFDIEADGNWSITIYNEGEQSAPSPTPTSQSVNL